MFLCSFLWHALDLQSTWISPHRYDPLTKHQLIQLLTQHANILARRTYSLKGRASKSIGVHFGIPVCSWGTKTAPVHALHQPFPFSNRESHCGFALNRLTKEGHIC